MQQQDAQYQLHLQQQQINELQRRAGEHNRLCDAIRSFYSEFMEGDQTVVTGANKESSLVLLDKLRGKLRVMLDGHRATEKVMRQGLGYEKAGLGEEDAIRLLEEKVRENRELVNEKMRLQEALQEQAKQLQGIEVCHQAEIQRMQAQTASMRDENKRMKELETRLVKAVEERDSLIRNRDTRLGRISELEAKLTQKDIDNQTAIHQAQTQNIRQINQLREEQKTHLKMIQESADKDEIIRDLRRKLKSVQENLNVRHLESARKTIQAQTEKLQHKEEELRALREQRRADVQQLQAQADVIGQLQLQLRALHGHGEEITSKTLPEEQQGDARPATRQGRSTKTREEEQTIKDMYTKQSYDEMLREKDKEIDELASRVRRLLALQHKANLSQKAFQEEKAILEAQITAQRDELQQLRRASSMTQVQSVQHSVTTGQNTQQKNEEMLRDLQNLRSFGVSAAATIGQHSATVGRQPRMRPTTGQKVYELDEVKRPATGSPTRRIFSDVPGTGYGYGAGQMIGSPIRDRTFGIQ